MRHYLRDVRRMHVKFGMPNRSPSDFAGATSDEAKFRYKFLVEELDELNKAKDIYEVIDALVDIAYIAFGSMLYVGIDEWGLPPANFTAGANTIEQIHTAMIQGDWSKFFGNDIIPVLEDELRLDPGIAINRLTHIASVCIVCISLLGYDFDQHWTEVHRANMAKVPCSPEHPSSRGHTDGSDLVKPKGWIAPNHKAVIRGDNNAEAHNLANETIH